MNKPTAREPRTIDSLRLPFPLLLALILITFPTARIPADDDKAGSVDQNKVPIHVRSRNFTEGDSITIDSLVALKSVRGEGRYEVRGRYRLTSKEEAHLAQWCSGGELRGNESIKVTRGEGEFRSTFSIVKKGSLHLSYYPIDGGNGFGSLYYDLADGSVQAAPQQVAVEWTTDRTKFFSLHYSAAYRDDAKRVREFLETCVKNLRVEFGDERVPLLLKPVSIDVYVHPHSNDKAREGMATLNTGAEHAEIHVLSPSIHRKEAQTSVGEPMDDNYIFKTLVHEYSTIVLERITREKQKGWRLFDAPSWFVQGYEEYLALTLSSQHSRSVTFQKYRDLHRAAPDRVTPDFTVQNDYIDGAVLLQFLHETYGKEKVHAVLVSDAGDFWLAVAQELDRNRAQLSGDWRGWLAAQ